MTCGVAMPAKSIDAKAECLAKLFEHSYTIEYYQREYAWSQHDVRVLVDDLCDQFDSWHTDTRGHRRTGDAPEYFLGPFVYHQEPDGLRFLVDGQQRFTTLHLIFVHLRRIVSDVMEPGPGRLCASRLDRLINAYDQEGRTHFRIKIDERAAALSAFYTGQTYEPPLGSSLSVRNLVLRSHDIDRYLRNRVDPESLADFVNWLLTRVTLVGVEAPDRDNAYRIFETMNDRGARLTPVDLLKSYLLSHVTADEEKLNGQWRRMLAELTEVRGDTDAPRKFLQSVLIARHARTAGENWSEDRRQIEQSLNIWAHTNARHLGLRHPAAYFGFVEDLTRLATNYRTFLEASRSRDPHHGLESIFFNEINGLHQQMIPILAAVRPSDQLSEAKTKTRLIANYLDRWYVQRIVADLPLQSRDIDEIIKLLVAKLRPCHSIDEVRAVLQALVIADGDILATFGSVGKRENNTDHVRYLLARLTAFVEVGCNQPNRIDEYLDGDRKWQIEHIWANKFERHRHEVEDEVKFRSLRNRLGVLVLLPARDNSSLGAMTYPEKVKIYMRQNALAAILSPDYRASHRHLADFVRDHSLESLFHGFGPHPSIESMVSSRQQLYLRLCTLIWDPERLGIGALRPTAPAHQVETSTELPLPLPAVNGAMLRTDLARMVRARVVSPGAKLIGTHRSRNYSATVQPDGAVVVDVSGDRFGNINDAGCAVKSTKTCEGMKFWRLDMPDGQITLSALRDAARRDGRLTAAGRAARP